MEVNSFNFSSLPKIIFGPGKFSLLPEMIKNFGSNVLILTGKSSLRKSGRLDIFVKKLNNYKIIHYIEEISNEPSPDIINNLVNKYKKTLPDVVVSIGGGSVLDSGKAVSAMLAEDGLIQDYLEGVGNKTPSGKKIPFIALPTTAGTGSEATKNAVISNIKNDGYKKSLRHDNYIPDIAILDPELTLGLASDITLSSGLDALSQLIESYISNNSNPLTDTLAIEGIKNISEAITEFTNKKSEELPLRSKMSYGAMLSGITLANAGLTIIHSLAGTIGGYYNISHGKLCAAILPFGLEIILKKALETKENIESSIVIEKYSNIYKTITNNSSIKKIESAKNLISLLKTWNKNLNIQSLSQIGLTNSDLEKISKFSSIKCTPVELNKEDIIIILQNAF